MKKTIVTSLMFAIIGFASFSQMVKKDAAGSIYKPSVGDILIYGVDFFGTEYDFEVFIKDMVIRDYVIVEKITLEYYMTNPSKTQGKVSISGDAFNSSRVQMNYFGGGEVHLDDMTTVILSQLVFQELVGEEKKTRISPDGGSSWVELKNKGLMNDYQLNGMDNDDFQGEAFEVNDLLHYYAQSEDGKVKYWINHDPTYPLILKMDLGWKIWLKYIERTPQ